MILSLAACGNKVEVTMQEIYNAGKTENLIKNHQSAHVVDETDGKIKSEKYFTKDYVYDGLYDEDFEWVEFTTNNANYYYLDNRYLRFWTITPDGVSSDFSTYLKETYAAVVFEPGTVDEIIESVSQKDGIITVKSYMSQKNIEEMAELGVASGNFEYMLDAKTRELVAFNGDYTNNDGTKLRMDSKVSYDTDAPERALEFLKYANETQNLRNITIISNPGTEKEVSQSFQAAKGLVVGLVYEEEEYVFEVHADAECTQPYDPYADTESDQTIYIKWIKEN
jgi:hypothetical protein